MPEVRTNMFFVGRCARVAITELSEGCGRGIRFGGQWSESETGTIKRRLTRRCSAVQGRVVVLRVTSEAVSVREQEVLNLK
jgi:hypothetical protein